MIAVLILAASAFSLIAGVYFGIRATSRPEFFWTYLIIGIIFTIPLAAGGYTWYDEIFVGGYLLANLLGKVRVKIKAPYILFSAFCIYMTFQAIRGIAFFSDYGLAAATSKIRWVVFFIIIFLVSVKSNSSNIKKRIDKDLSYKITKAGLVFIVIYIAMGLISIYTTGSIAFTQYAQLSGEFGVDASPLIALFGGTAYVVCVFIVIVPAALATVKSSNRKRSNTAWVTIGVALTAQILYNSRSGVLITLTFLGLFFYQNLLSRRVLRGLMIFVPLVGLALLFQLFFNEVSPEILIRDMLHTLGLGDTSRYDVALKDIDRKVWNRSAILALSENTPNLLFGWGMRTSGYIVAPYVYDSFLATRGFAEYSEDVAIPGFATLAVDTGLVGLLFILVLWLSCLVGLYRRIGKADLVFLFAPTAFILQLFVANIFDVIVLYLALMPSGLYVAIATSRASARKY